MARSYANVPVRNEMIGPTLRFSPYGAASRDPAPVNRMMAAFAADFRDGSDINLGVGYVNEKTLPAGAIRDAVDHVLAYPAEFRQPLNYGGPEGAPQLISAIRRYLGRFHGLGDGTLSRTRVIVGASGATSLLEALADVIEPGIVLTADPMYYIYCDCLMRKGYDVVTVPEEADGLPPAALAERIDRLGERRDAVRFIYSVTVNNPSGTILPYARRLELLDVARRLSRDLGRPVPLILDRAYELLIHDPETERPRSLLPDDTDGLVYEVDTLSKVFAPALRVGFMTGHDGPLMDAMVQKTSDTGFSAPLLNQYVAARLLDTELDTQLAEVNQGYREKAVVVRAAIDETLGPHLEHIGGGQAGFYFYLTFKSIETHEQSPFFRYLARTTGDPAIDGPHDNRAPRVVYIPGAFCVHPQGAMAETGRRQLRLSYGFEDTPRIIEAVAIMAEAATDGISVRM